MRIVRRRFDTRPDRVELVAMEEGKPPMSLWWDLDPKDPQHVAEDFAKTQEAELRKAWDEREERAAKAAQREYEPEPKEEPVKVSEHPDYPHIDPDMWKRALEGDEIAIKDCIDTMHAQSKILGLNWEQPEMERPMRQAKVTNPQKGQLPEDYGRIDAWPREAPDTDWVQMEEIPHPDEPRLHRRDNVTRTGLDVDAPEYDNDDDPHRFRPEPEHTDKRPWRCPACIAEAKERAKVRNVAYASACVGGFALILSVVQAWPR